MKIFQDLYDVLKKKTEAQKADLLREFWHLDYKNTYNFMKNSLEREHSIFLFRNDETVSRPMYDGVQLDDTSRINQVRFRVKIIWNGKY